METADLPLWKIIQANTMADIKSAMALIEDGPEPENILQLVGITHDGNYFYALMKPFISGVPDGLVLNGGQTNTAVYESHSYLELQGQLNGIRGQRDDPDNGLLVAVKSFTYAGDRFICIITPYNYPTPVE